MWHPLKLAAGLLALLLAGGAAANTTLTLDRWLAKTVAPDLARTLALHPKFKGEVIRMSPMQGGQLVERSSLLVHEIETDLTHHLNRHEGLRIRFRGQPQRPTDRPVHYVLGIEVQPLGSYQHRVTLAMVDLSEGIWVAGTAARWQGRLTREQQKLAKTIAPTAPNFTAMLEPLSYRTVPREGVCEGKKRETCVEVTVRLNHPATLVMFNTEHGKLTTSCAAPTEREPGTYRFRISVAKGRDTRADAGVYAVATDDPFLAKSLHTIISQNATASCGGTRTDDWQPNLQHALARAPDRYEWQALHLTRERGRLQTL